MASGISSTTELITSPGKLLLIYVFNFHVLNHFLLIHICKLHWNFKRKLACLSAIFRLCATSFGSVSF